MTARLVLVHSPLVGCATWDLVGDQLAGAGYQVVVPDLTGTVMAGPPYAPRQAELIARSVAHAPAILIGHSGAGPLLPAAAAMSSAGAAGYVFVDAGLPIPGQAWMDTVPPDLGSLLRQLADDRAWLPPWPQWWGDELARLLPEQAVREAFIARCPRLPLAMFTELHSPGPRWPEAPAAYLLLSQAYEREAATARHRGWPVMRLMSHHLAMLTQPARTATALADLIRKIPSKGLGTARSAARADVSSASRFWMLAATSHSSADARGLRHARLEYDLQVI